MSLVYFINSAADCVYFTYISPLL